MARTRVLPVTVYSPDSSLAHPRTMLRAMFRDLAVGRELAMRLAVRDLSAQYRQAFLGFLWAIVVPLANAIVWLFLSGTGVVKLSTTPLPYTVYVFTGTMLWAVFMDAVNAPLQGATAARPMLAKVNFPREAIVVSGVYQTLFNATIKVFLVLLVGIWFGVAPSWGGLLIPIGALSLVMVGTSIGVLVTPIGLLYQDVGRGLPILLQFLMYSTPVVFAMPEEGLAATVFRFNPLTPVIETTRAWLTGQSPEMLSAFVVVNSVVALFLLLVWLVYRLAMPILIERMGA